ncbi:hypothetical protein [Marinigracilibium pacificum]|uniref:Uncharacterized protein n=1 Tax=Marinigracilibium pacificum TaxID=2729599 RepID=A0A848IVZ2_9BACT|nr:hypothetical protein [Marinigracilibium pacificum]NMM47445.1 hypothetical protein [Marinigracilibium pacificum]
MYFFSRIFYWVTIALFFTLELSAQRVEAPHVISKSIIDEINLLTEEIGQIVVSDSYDESDFTFSEDSIRFTYHENIDSATVSIYSSIVELDQENELLDVINVVAMESMLLWLNEVNIVEERLVLTFLEPEAYYSDGRPFHIHLIMYPEEVRLKLSNRLNEILARMKLYLKAKKDNESCNPQK